MGCKSPRVGHCDARTPRSVRYVRTRPVLLPSPGVYGRIFCPHGWWLCGLFVWRFSSPGKRRPESCTTHVLSGQSAQIPLCGVLSTKRAPFGVGNRRRGIFCDEIAIGRLCPAAGAGRFQQDLLHLRPLRFHVRREPQLRAAAVEVLRWPVDLEIDIAVQIVLQKAHTKLDR